jgi:hypothetical protein
MTVHCVICGKEFTPIRPSHIFCSKKCREKRWRSKESAYLRGYMEKNPIKALVRAAKNRARKKGIPCTIKAEDLYLPEYCPVLGIKLKSNWGTGPGGKADSYSLDRIDPTKGYIPGNVQIMSHRANSMKSSATNEELINFANWVLKEIVL